MSEPERGDALRTVYVVATCVGIGWVGGVLSATFTFWAWRTFL